MKFLAINVVWGTEYSRFFVDVSLPATLFNGNLEHLAKNNKLTYRLYSTEQDFDVIRKSPAFSHLLDLAVVEWIPLNNLKTDKYENILRCHNDALKCYSGGENFIVFLSPNIVLSKDAMIFVEKKSEEGKRAIITPGLHISKDVVMKILGESTALSVNPREMVSLAISYPHLCQRLNSWDGNKISDWPVELFWPVGNHGLLLHTFYLHPIMVQPREHIEALKLGIDIDLVPRVCHENDIEIVTDSDSLCIYEAVSNKKWPLRFCPKMKPIWGIHYWMKQHTISDYNKYCFRSAAKFHTLPLTSEWDKVEKDSLAVVDKILK